MSDQRDRGFVRAMGADPLNGRPEPDLMETEPAQAAEVEESGYEPPESDVRGEPERVESGRSRVSVSENTAAQEHQLLMSELHDPMGVDPRPRVEPTDRRREEELQELREKLYRQLEGYAPERAEEPVEQSTPSEENMFSALSNRFREVARKRMRPVAGRHVRRLVIGAALVVGAGLVINEVQEYRSAARLDTVIGLQSNFGTVRSIVREPGMFLRRGIAGELGADYARGAAAAEVALLEEAFIAVTDSEARIAIASSAVERALVVGDVQALAIWLKRLSTVERADEDPRTAVIREKGYRRLAEVEAARGQDAEARRWTLWAEKEAEKAQKLRGGLADAGWSPMVAGQLASALELARARLPDNASSAYRAGFNSALTEAEQALERMVEVAITPKRAVRAR